MTPARDPGTASDPSRPAEPRTADGDPALDRETRVRLVARDPDALGRFFDAFFDRVHAYVHRLVRERHLAEDLTQDVFLHVHRSLESYDPDRPLAPWVFTIATNKVRDHWRSRRHRDARHEVSADDEDGPPEVASEGRGPRERLEGDELAATVAAAVEDLPPILRETLVLRYFEGLSFAAIGEVVDRNETAVRKRYSRALGELRARLGDGLDGAAPPEGA